MIRKGEVVVTQKREKGSPKKTGYMSPKKGEEDEKVLTKCGPGDYFGELALMKDEPRKANVTAENEVECFTLVRVPCLCPPPHPHPDSASDASAEKS
jgi:CRP-like cAMP-binding protein